VKHGLGYQPDPAGHCVTAARHLLGVPAITPPSATLHAAALAGPGIMDQSITEACVAFATIGAIETRMAARHAPIPHRSPLCVYDLARAIDRVPNADGTLPPLLDLGSMPNQAMRALSEWGVCAYDARPTDSGAVNAEPSLEELSAAAAFELAGYYRIDAFGSARVGAVRQAIAQGYPVCFAVNVDAAFEAYDGSGVLGPPDFRELRGGHYLYAVGYRTDVALRTVFEFANSWGTAWGRSGFGEGNEAFVSGWSDVYVMDVRPA
jgi:hypothetical protein